MSIEIKELVVKFNVIGKNEQTRNNNNDNLFSPMNYKKLVKDCTEQVLKELEFKIER